MKTKIIYSFLSLFFAAGLFAQDRTTVRANSYEVSDNLDLRAVASIFGESRNLEDFEQRLNDPNAQISNLDLNDDNEVDYIRVIEATQDNTRLVILQAVLARDVYQDVATIEVERRGNDIQVQVVGDVYMYGPNYIYEPVYVARPVFFDFWWAVGYRPYVSTWYWGYYPHYWHVWHPMPVYRYRNHVHVHINVHNHYNYVNVRRSTVAANLYRGRRADAYARQYPERAFTQRHANVANRYELDKKRGLDTRTTSTRTTRENATSTRSVQGAKATRGNASSETRSATRKATAPAAKDYPTRSNPTGGRENSATGTKANAVRSNEAARSTETRSTRPEATKREPASASATRGNTPAKVERSQPTVRQSAPSVERQSAPRVQPQAAPRTQSAPKVQSAPRAQQPSQRVQQQSAPRAQSAPRMEQPRSSGQDRGGRR